jgi:hypothetical protein
MAVMAQHLNGTAPRLDRTNPAVSLELTAIVATCLARDPIDRYADMAGLINVLDHPESADLTILEKINSPAEPAKSLMQIQAVQGVLIAIGIMGGLILLALALQYLNR